MKVLNFGSLNVDYVYNVDHMVQGGETLTSAGMNVFLGGKGFNQSASLAKAGLEVYSKTYRNGWMNLMKQTIPILKV